MILYQVFKNDNLIKDNCTISEAYQLLPAGCELVSGNTSRMVKTQEGALEEVKEIKAVFQIPCKGGKITIIQKP